MSKASKSSQPKKKGSAASTKEASANAQQANNAQDPRRPAGRAEGASERIAWAKEQMEHAYRIEVGLEAAPKKRQQGKEVKEDQEDLQGGKDTAQHTMLTRGEQDAAREEALMTDIVSQVEKERAERMKKNKEKMAQLGLFDAAISLEEAAAKPAPASRKRKERPEEQKEGERKSARARHPVERFGDLVKESKRARGSAPVPTSKCAAFGQPAGVEVGRLWLSRVQVSEDGVHGPWVGGIHGNAVHGAYSVVLSGGYEGDVDKGTEFTFTGSGGRDLSGNKRTAPQSYDQELVGSNRALAVSMWRKLPLRVIRGFKSKNDFSPTVADMWPEIGESGFVIWRYHMRRLPDQATPPWEIEGWRKSEAKKIAALKKEYGEKSLIPEGTGTMVLSAKRKAQLAKAKKGAKVGARST